MARPPRLEVAGGIYHVIARGNERQPIFHDDNDRTGFLELVAEVKERYRWRVLAYCLLTNHYHLLAQTCEPNLARGMRQLNGVYAQRFNRRHDRVGHLLQGRYLARLVQADEHLLAVVRYIVRNPLRAGLCERAEEWRWSSHRATLGLSPPSFLEVDALLSHYAPSRETARRLYRVQTEQPDREQAAAHPLVVGDVAFAENVLARLQTGPGIPSRYRRGPRPALQELLGNADRAGILLAREHGYSLREIARQLGVNPSTVLRRLRRLQVSGTATIET